jgi:hypothetical protein
LTDRRTITLPPRPRQQSSVSTKWGRYNTELVMAFLVFFRSHILDGEQGPPVRQKTFKNCKHGHLGTLVDHKTGVSFAKSQLASLRVAVFIWVMLHIAFPCGCGRPLRSAPCGPPHAMQRSSLGKAMRSAANADLSSCTSKAF